MKHLLIAAAAMLALGTSAMAADSNMASGSVVTDGQTATGSQKSSGTKAVTARNASPKAKAAAVAAGGLTTSYSDPNGPINPADATATNNAQPGVVGGIAPTPTR